MQQDKNQPQVQQHDVDEHNREEQEKTPGSSFSGTNIDRYVAGESGKLPEEEQKDTGVSNSEK